MREVTSSSEALFLTGAFAVMFFFGLGLLPNSEPSASATEPESPRLIDAAPRSTTASFGDWTLHCQTLVEGAETQHVCEVVQQVRAQGQQNPIGALAIGRLKKTDPLVLTVVLPVNIAFSAPPSFLATDAVSGTFDLSWRKCLPGGCFADVVISDDLLLLWKTEESAGRLIWKDAAGRDIAFLVSSYGLAQALDALDNEP